MSKIHEYEKCKLVWSTFPTTKKEGLPGLSGCELLLHTSSFQMVAAVIPHCVCPLHLLVLSGFIAALLHTMASLNFIRLNLL
jgi:hypothetical protein